MENETDVMLKNDEAKSVLKRFGPQLRWTVQSVVTSFELSYQEYEELRQVAETLVITYAGLMNKPVGGSNRLAHWTEITNGDENQIKHFLARQLRIELSRIVGSQIEKNAKHFQVDSLDTLISDDDDAPGDEPGDFEWEDRQIAAIDNSKESKRIHRLYPTMALTTLEGMTYEETANELGISVATVKRHLAKEKHQFLVDSVRRKGLRVEGDETDEELQEAYDYLTQYRDK